MVDLKRGDCVGIKDNQIEFLYQSIADAQGTIRALDVKIGFLLLIVFSPLFAFDKLGPFMVSVYRESGIQHVLIALITLLWALATIAQFTALAAISNPTTKVVGAAKLGAFFSGNLFTIGLRDIFYNRRMHASFTLDEEVTTLPATEEKIVEELVFEKMKLAYIRSIKMKRFNFAIWSVATWLAFAIASYALHLSAQC
jgi:hypothetical protein